MDIKPKQTYLLIVTGVVGFASWIAGIVWFFLLMENPKAVMAGGTPSSPSGLYAASFEKRPDPDHDDKVAWVLVIKDSDGKVSYEEDPGFARSWVGSVSWRWDGGDRVWLFDGKDGRLWVWERQKDEWTKRLFDGDTTAFEPPEPFTQITAKAQTAPTDASAPRVSFFRRF